MRSNAALYPARQVGPLVLLVTILALIITTALVHLAPPQSPDGALHVAGITNPVTGSALELSTAEGESPAAPHHEHFERDHDGTVQPRVTENADSVADVPAAIVVHLREPAQDPVGAPHTRRDLPGPSLAALSINRT
jgi:hypothetical protein